MSAVLGIALLVLAITAIIGLGVYIAKTTPTLKDSMSVPRNVPADKGIADLMHKEAVVESIEVWKKDL